MSGRRADARAGARDLPSALRGYLDAHAAGYETVRHPRAATSSEVAAAAEVPGDRLAKAVIVEDAIGYVAIVVPVSQHVDLGAVRERRGRQCGLATEQEIEALFADCAPGSIPAPAQAFGLEVMLEETLLGLEDIYFHSGCDTQLIRISGRDFAELMRDATVGHFTEDWEKRAAYAASHAAPAPEPEVPESSTEANRASSANAPSSPPKRQWPPLR